MEESIGHMESQIERAIQSLASGTGDVEKVMEIIAERRKTQLERMFQLGEAHAEINELENRIQELDEREQKQQAEPERENAVPVQEDHLDWLRPALNAPKSDHSQDEQHQEREGREPEDYLDWLKR